MPVRAPGRARRGRSAVRFYTGSMFPSEYRDAAIVDAPWILEQDEAERLRRGAGEHHPPTGRTRVGPPLHHRLHGPRGPNKFWGRPVDVMQMPDGSMLVADEQMGAIYRVSYAR